MCGGHGGFFDYVQLSEFLSASFCVGENGFTEFFFAELSEPVVEISKFSLSEQCYHNSTLLVLLVKTLRADFLGFCTEIGYHYTYNLYMPVR